MLTKTKIAMAALLIAVVATPTFARDYQHHTKHARSYGTPSLRLIEGRNAAVWSTFSGTSTDRESLVQTLGN